MNFLKALQSSVFITLIFLSCSKSSEQAVGEDEKGVVTPIQKVTATRTDSILVGDWLYVGSSVAHAPYFIPARDSVIVSFKSNNTFIDSGKNKNSDYGRFWVVDSLLSNGERAKMLNRVSALVMGVDAPEFLKISFVNDTLILDINNQGIINSKYIRIKPKGVAGTAGTLSKPDSVVSGSWRYLGSRVDYSPYYLEAQPGTSGSITFKDNSSYVKMYNGATVDSGRYRVVDTAFSPTHQTRIIHLTNGITQGHQARFFYLTVRNDSLSLSNLLVAEVYKRAK